MNWQFSKLEPKAKFNSNAALQVDWKEAYEGPILSYPTMKCKKLIRGLFRERQ